MLKSLNSQLSKKPLENLWIKNRVEKILTEKRGSSIKWPKKSEQVIVLVSGGVDSICAVGLLIEKFGVIVHPLFLKRGQKREQNELDAAKYYIKKYQDKYDHKCRNLEVIETYIPPKKIRWVLTAQSNKRVSKRSKQLRGIPLYLQSLSTTAVQYAMYLEIKHKIKIRSIFVGFVNSDGEAMSYETLTALRAQTLNIRVLQNDYSWSITSPFLDNKENILMEKSDAINWLLKNNIDPSKTWSCYYSHKHQCGVCDGCIVRKKHYKKAKAKDNTIYRFPNFLDKIRMKILEKINYEKYHELHF